MKTKKCATCNQKLSINKFGKDKNKKDGYKYSCLKCCREYSKQHYRQNKNKYIKKNNNWREKNKIVFYNWLKEQKCLDCGNDDFRVLEFDHCRDIKEYGISTRIGDYTLQSMQEELDKCDIVCANCHKIRTAIRENQYQYLRRC